MPEQCTAVAVLGGCVLDLRAAQLSAPVTTITVVAIMGGVEVIVPPGVRVEMHGQSLMGGWSNHVREEYLPPDAPQVHVHGFVLMGGVEVRTKSSRARDTGTDGMNACVKRTSRTSSVEPFILPRQAPLAKSRGRQALKKGNG